MTDYLDYYYGYLDGGHDVWLRKQPYKRTAYGWLMCRGDTCRLRSA